MISEEPYRFNAVMQECTESVKIWISNELPLPVDMYALIRFLYVVMHRKKGVKFSLPALLDAMHRALHLRGNISSSSKVSMYTHKCLMFCASSYNAVAKQQC